MRGLGTLLNVGPLAVLGAFDDGLRGDLGLLVIAIGLRLLGVGRVRVANLLPAVLFDPVTRPQRTDGGWQWAR
jgi:uncharacterized membrane protein YqgA involved in biofilm formation